MGRRLKSSETNRSSLPAGVITWTERDIRNRHCKYVAFRSDDADQRPWLQHAPVVAALSEWQISHAGYGDFPAPFEVVRTSLPGAFFLSTLSGEGRVFIDGRWQRCRAGQAVVLQPGVVNAFHTSPAKTWTFCWARYRDGCSPSRHSGERTQWLDSYDSAPLKALIMGLDAEARGRQQPHLLRRWCEMLHEYIRAFCLPSEIDPRVDRLWQAVEATPGRKWTMSEMSQLACVSEEHLRRLCRRACGRSPRNQLMLVRMRHAAELLRSTDWTVETVSREVGYQNPFVFSTTFKRLMGWPPSQYASRSLDAAARVK